MTYGQLAYEADVEKMVRWDDLGILEQNRWHKIASAILAEVSLKGLPKGDRYIPCWDQNPPLCTV